MNILSLLLLYYHEYVTGVTINVDKVRYCTAKQYLVFCEHWKTQDKYIHWVRNGVSNNTQKHIYLSEVFKPNMSDVRNLVFLAPGQQFGEGSSQEISGAPNKWNKGWQIDVPSKSFILSPRTLPYQLIQQGYFSSNDTAFFLAFRHNFGYTLSRTEKQNMENAFYDWLTSSFVPENLQFIFLAGFSRGGCLAMRLAERFAEDFPQVKMVVNSYDGVCVQVEHELGTYYGKIYNPLIPYYGVYAWKTYLEPIYPSRNLGNIRLSLFVGGYHPFGRRDISMDRLTYELIRPFTYASADQPVIDKGWIHQKWLKGTHSFIGREFVTKCALRNFVASAIRVYSTGSHPSKTLLLDHEDRDCDTR